jgi:3-oxoacyl-[acyl-carrier protein] reductase
LRWSKRATLNRLRRSHVKLYSYWSAPKPEDAAYTTSKHGVIGFTRQLCFDYARKGIRCNVVCPGAVETGMTHEIFSSGDAEVMKAVESAPIGRWAQPEELAAALLFLASDDASFVNGAVYVVDGGFDSK